MEPTNQPSPYFIRRTVRPETPAIELREFSVVEDQVHPLRDYWLIVKRHRWLIVSCALVVFIGAALYTFTRTPLYTSETTLLIERKAPQFLKLQDARGDADDYNQEFYKTQYEILKSRALAERVVRDEALEAHPAFGGGKNTLGAKEGLVSGLWQQLKTVVKESMPARPAAPPDVREAIPLSTQLAVGYQSMLEVRPVAGTSLVVIKITTPDAALSARLANAHAASYVRYGNDLRSQTNSDAGEFLQQKLTELKERVEQSEAALNSYRKEKGIISVDDKSNVIIERLLDLNKGLTAAEGERIAWEALVRAARGRNPEEVPSVRSSTAISSLKAELAKLEGEHASLAKEFKSGYPPLDVVKTRLDETRRRLSGEIDREIKSIEAGYAAASNKEANMRAAMDEQKRTTLSLKDSAVQYAILAREVDTNKQLYDGVLSRLKEIGVAAEVRSTNIHVMGNAIPPGFPSYPDKRRTMMLGLLLGLAAGMGLAFLREQLDNTLKTPEEAERYLHLPNLGMVPDFAAMNGTGKGFVSRLVKSAQAELPLSARKEDKVSRAAVLLEHDPLSVVSEAYRSLRSALLLSQAGGPPHVVLVTSAVRGDGKTTTLVNTAIVFAQLGIRVLIIDADLRRSSCHRQLNMDNSLGLSDLLAGQIEPAQAIRPTPAKNLFFISGGTLPPNPAELLGSEKMHGLLQELRAEFEFIFIDTSPVLAVSDPVFLSTMVDGTLFVVGSRTPKPLIKKARARLNITQTKLLGMLLNRVDIQKNEYSGYYQQYYTYYRDAASALDNPAIFENGNGRTLHDATAHAGNGNGKSLRPSRRQGKVAAHKVAQPAENRVVAMAPAAPLPTGALDVVCARLIDVIGPMARLVVAEQVRALGETMDSFPPARLEELVARLSNEIPDELSRRKFEIEMAREIEILIAPQDSGFLVRDQTRTGSSDLRSPLADLRPLTVVCARLMNAMGPMARLVVAEQVRALGETAESFPPARLEELASRLSKEIPDDVMRRKFEIEMALEIETRVGHRDTSF